MMTAAWDWLLAFLTVFSLALLATSTRSYLRTRHSRILLVCVAFAIFFLKSATLSVGQLLAGSDTTLLLFVATAADIAILGTFYVAVSG